MPNGILEVKQIKQLSADGGGTVVDVEYYVISKVNSTEGFTVDFSTVVD